MQLPAELRQHVYRSYIRDLFAPDRPGPAVIIAGAGSSCPCPPNESQRTRTAASIGMSLCRTSRAIKDEILAVWYESQVFHFACCCELSEFFSSFGYRS